MAGIYNLGLIMDSLEASDLSENEINQIWEVMLENINPSNLELTLIVAKAIARLAPAT